MLTKYETKRQEVIDLRVAKISKLQAKRDNLVDRLDKGAVKIEQNRYNPKVNITEWEDQWIALMEVYKKVCSDLRDLHSSKW